MNYEFPTITHIDQVRDAIAGRDEFIIAEREGYKVANYLVHLPESFPPVDSELMAIRRECRGLVFNDYGRVIARRYHKFFNVGEKPETVMTEIPLWKPHTILEKLDGSMITPIPMPNGTIRWGSKMGLTDVSMNAEAFIAEHPEYQALAKWAAWDMNATPIFEWCSNKNRIVVNHPEDKLVLTAIRYNDTGTYEPYRFLKDRAARFHVPLVHAFPGSVESMEALMANAKGLVGSEGFVLRFEDGHMVKVKGEWYVNIHKAKDQLIHEKNVIWALINEKIDDVKLFLLPEDLKQLEDFEKKFWYGINYNTTTLGLEFNEALEKYGDKKSFAVATANGEMPHWKRSLIFGLWDGKGSNAFDLIVNRVKGSVSSQTKVDSARHLWNDAKWHFGSVEEASD